MNAHAKSSSQVAAARRTVLALPEPDLTALSVTGKDRVTWLNGLVTCDLAKCPEGEARYGLVVVRSGRMLADVTILVLPDAALVVVPLARRAALREHLDHYLVMEDAEIAPDATLEVWSLHGPRAGEVLRAAVEAGAAGAPIDRTELGGAVLVVPPGRAEAVRAALERSVASADGVVGDAEGWEALRLERGLPRFGVDFDEKMYPQEAALEKAAVSFNKGCYLGQEVVCMLEMRGHVKRKLVSIVLDDDGQAGHEGGGEPPARGAPVTDEGGTAVGEVTSLAASPTLGKPVGLAMVKRALAEPGSRLVVAGKRAKVVQRPA